MPEWLGWEGTSKPIPFLLGTWPQGSGRLVAQEGDWATVTGTGRSLSVPGRLCGSGFGRRPQHICTAPAAGVMSSFSCGEGSLQSVGVRNCIWQVQTASPGLSAELAAGNFSSNAGFIHGIKEN